MTNVFVTLCVKLSYLVLFFRKLNSTTGTPSFCTQYYHQDDAANQRSRPQGIKVKDLLTCNSYLRALKLQSRNV